MDERRRDHALRDIYHRLATLAAVEWIAHGDGDPAQMLERIRAELIRGARLTLQLEQERMSDEQHDTAKTDTEAGHAAQIAA